MPDRSHYFATGGPWSIDLLANWRWLVGPAAFTVPRVTAMGSLFLRHPDGPIYFLNTTDGTFERVADSEEAIDELPNASEHRFNLFLGFLVRELRSEGIVLGPGQCYGWKLPLSLGGEPDAANVEVTDVTVHVSIQGQLHEQVRGLRDGTRIDGVQVIAPEPPT